MEFLQFLEETGVKALPTAVDNPQENGIMEHMERDTQDQHSSLLLYGHSLEEGMLALLNRHRSMSLAHREPHH